MSSVRSPWPFCFHFKDGKYALMVNGHAPPKILSIDTIGWGDYITIQHGLERRTFIDEGVQLDSHVHIGHDSIIGKHVRICAGAIIGGFVEIGDYATIYIGALIHPRVKIGEHATVGMGSVVLHDIPDGETWVGNPARKLR
jgi:UDP-3-O-[3-hydroxymyristoyl] glucosamine N-acyltransferase